MQNDTGFDSPPVPLAQTTNPEPGQGNDAPNPMPVNPVVPTSDDVPAPQPAGPPPPPVQPLDGAPESMKQQAPSSFDPAGGKKKGGKKGMFCTCTCGIIAFIFLVVGGLFAYAYFTDTEIPVVSDIIEKIEALFRDPVEEAKAVQEKIANTLLSTIIPLASKDGNIIAALADSSVSEEYIKSLVDNYEEVKSVRFDVSGTMNFNSSASSEDTISMLSVGKMDMSLVGAYNGKETDNQKMELKFDVNVENEGIGVDMLGEMRAVGTETYVKLDTFPFLTSGEFGDVKGQWIDVSADDVSTATGIFGGGTSVKDSEKQEVANEDVAKLIEFITDESVVQNAELLPDENIGGEDCYCVKLSWNKEEMKEVLKTYASIYGEEYNESDIDESLKDYENLSLEGCLGETSEKIHRISISMSGTSDGQPSNVDLDLKLWDYDADIEIVAPEGAKKMDEIMSEIDPTYGDYAVQSKMMEIQVAIEEYYFDNQKYPTSLSVLDIESTVIEGETVHYQKTKDSYKLWITLPSGEMYELPSTY
ncbi:MAG: hypothetical protein ABIE03_06945 [Patescibacteria group bacterium]|nr:hypothetical protein [Patescibacteria group bacterium]